MAKGKILKFNKSPDFTFEFANKLCAEGKYALGISALKELADSLFVGSEDFVSVKMEIASCYIDLELYSLALSEYFLIMRYGFDLDEIFYNVARCCTELGLGRQAAMYLNLGVELGVLLPEDGFAKIELKSNPKLRLVKENSCDYALEIARKLINVSDDEYAKQVLKTVEPTSPQYVEACNYLAVISLTSDEAKEAVEYLKKSLSISPNDLMALTEILIAYYTLGDQGGVNKIADKLMAMNITKYKDLFKVAVAFAQIQNSNMALYYTDKLLEEKPFDLDINIINAISAYNEGNSEKAKNTIATIQKIYPDNFVLRYYSFLMDSKKPRIFCSPSIPPDDFEKILEELSEWLSEQPNKQSLGKKIIKDSGRLSEFLWIITEGPQSVATLLIEDIAFAGDGWEQIFRDLLVSLEVDPEVKKAILDKYLIFSNGGQFELLNNYIIQVFSPDIPEVTTDLTFIHAYYNVYSCASFIEIGFDKKLNTAYRKLYKDYEYLRNAFSEKQFAAILAFQSKISKVFSKLSDCCNVFDCNYKDLKQLLMEVGSLVGNDEFFKSLEKNCVLKPASNKDTTNKEKEKEKKHKN